MLSSLLLLKLFEVFDDNISILGQIADGVLEEQSIDDNLNVLSIILTVKGHGRTWLLLLLM